MTLIVDDERKQSSKGHAPIRYELVNTGVIGIDRLLRYNIIDGNNNVLLGFQELRA